MVNWPDDGGSGSINYGRSVAGEVTSVTNATYTNAPYNPPNLVSNVVNGPDGPVTYTLGNGLNVFRGYDPLGRLGEIWVCSGAAPASANCSGGSTVYAVVSGQKGSQVQTELDTVLSQQFSYGYTDGLNRLTARTNTSGAPDSYTYSYDRYGNRVSQTPLNGGYTFNPTINPANNHITTSGYLYDAAGNLTNDSVNAYTYDAEGNVTKVVSTGGTSQYVYDALNRRVHAQTPSATVDYIYDYAGRRISTWTSPTFASEAKIYWGAGQQLGFRAYDGTTYFDHQDVLGTERLRTNYSGGVGSTYSSLPWGDAFIAVVNNTWADQDNEHFAGQEHDAESDTEHAQFRNYASAQGRWLVPDPYLGSYDFTNPQSFNRYAYALNNPLSSWDPSGLEDEQACGSDDDGCGGSDDGGGDPPPAGYSYSGVNRSDSNPIYTDSSGNQFIGAAPSSDTSNTSATSSVNGPGVTPAYVDPFGYFSAVPQPSGPGGGGAPSRHSNPIPIKGFQVCGAGVFAYGGRSFDAGPVNGFAGVIEEVDSNYGISNGALFELGGGEGYMGGAGKIVSSSSNGIGSSGLVYRGVGGGVLSAHGAAGLVGFSSGGGVFGEVSAGGREVGVGGYLNLATTGGCPKS